MAEESKDILKKLSDFRRKPSLSRLKEIIPFAAHPDDEVKTKAISLITNTVKKSLFDSYHEMDAEIRKGLVHLLEKVNPDIVSLMRKEIYSNDTFKRVRAIQILGLVENKKEQGKYLHQMIKDSDVRIRATVIRTLGELIDKSEVNILMSLLNDFDERVRANTIEALGNLKNKNLVGIISRFRKDSHNRIRANAIKALWNLGNQNIKPYLMEMLLHPDENMRASGAWLLGELGEHNSSFIDYIKVVKYSDSILVRNNIIRALLRMEPIAASYYLNSLFDTYEIEEVKQLYKIK